MKDKRLRAVILGVAVISCGAAALIVLAPMTAQQATMAPVVIRQPESPLEILSMRQLPVPAEPNVPAHVAARMAKYELVMQNKTNVPIVAYAIGHKQEGEGNYGTCQSGYSFTGPIIAAAETKTIDMNAHMHGSTTITPVVDLVLLENGSYFGRDECELLTRYQERMDERRTTYGLILRRLQADGVEKTTLWLKQELSRNIQPFQRPKKMR